MDLLHIALSQYSQFGTRLCAGMTQELADDLEAWLRGSVCGVSAFLTSVERFRRVALWSVNHLAIGATTPERRLVEAVDKALVAKANVVADGARNLGLLARIDPAKASPPQSKAERRPRIEWLADHPWHDLVAGDDFFACTAGLRAIPSRLDCSSAFWKAPDPRIPLGDFVARAMFRRIDVLSDVLHEEQQVVEAAAMAKLQRKKNKRLELGTLERLAQTTCELNKLVERLRTSCHEGEGARLRDACCSLIQILAAYHANPDLGWLGVNASYWKVEGEIIRSYVRSQGMQTFARREANGTLNLLGNETVSLCRPEILAGVAAALVDITPLFRRSVESEELIEALSEERRLVLVDLRPRRVYWDGVQIDQDWDINQKSWELLWALAERAQKSQPLDAEDLAEMNQEGSPVKHRRRRLKLLLDEALDNKIKPVPPKGYRLDLKPSELAMLQIKDQFGLVEVGIDQLPPITVGSAI